MVIVISLISATNVYANPKKVQQHQSLQKRKQLKNAGFIQTKRIVK